MIDVASVIRLEKPAAVGDWLRAKQKKKKPMLPEGGMGSLLQ
jgi:hypothetical protein